MPTLTAPAPLWHSAWLESHQEWGPGLHEDGFGLLPDDDVSSAGGFGAWVTRLSDDRQCRYWWITERDDVLGGIAMRHASHPLVTLAGHIGYGIRPSARGRGLATWAVARIVAQAHTAGMERLVAVCEVDNEASAKTLERQGGVLDRAVPESGVLRYRIETAPAAG